ncbi:unnamed protein product [Bemisia tabaci]|uniref:rRNA adenine N(6)-methyltransferase n=1 Tax=Bemisia tabaci TaxID=7038 RepID=A0A9P0F9Q7_BEMTA|nr:unnamed protein product [Bemisia tabaci]
MLQFLLLYMHLFPRICGFLVLNEPSSDSDSHLQPLVLSAVNGSAVNETNDGLPPTYELVAKHGLKPNKRLGQHFLYDRNVIGRIVEAAGPLAGMTVVEIGPGPGGLTRALLAGGAARVVAIERDPRALSLLRQLTDAYHERLTVVDGDALGFDPRPLIAGEPALIVANLPYNIGSELLYRWVSAETWPPWWQRAVLMFQREVALRIVATPEQRADYGRLAVLCGWRTRAEIVLDVPPEVFTPRPAVNSSVVRLVPRAEPLPCRAGALVTVAKATFTQRRKMMRNSLGSLTNDPEALLRAAGLQGDWRPEQVPVDGFVRLALAYDEYRRTEASSTTPGTV